MSINSRSAQYGMTIVEAILGVVIVGIALTAVMSVFVVTTQHSADPMARLQAQIVAEGYLEEILLKPFYDSNTGKVCPGGAPSHAAYVCGYDTLSESPMAGYTATVAVVSAGAALGSLNNADGTIRVLRVDVTVTGPGNTSITLSGYRANYECNSAADPGNQCKPLT